MKQQPIALSFLHQLRSKFSKDPLFLSIQMCMLTGILLALSLPQDIHIPVFISEVSTYIPSIENYARASDFHNVTVVFRTTMWLLVPLFLMYFLKIELLKMPSPLLKENVTYGELIKLMLWAILGWALLSFFLALFVFMPTDLYVKVHSEYTNRGIGVLKLMSNSRFGLGVFGSLEIYVNILIAFYVIKIPLIVYWVLQKILIKFLSKQS